MGSSQSVQTGFSRIAEALGDPVREAMVSALADGKALPAGELAAVAGISPQGASAHLQKLVDARVLSVWAQGRFRYYRIRDDDVAALIENLVDLAAKSAAKTSAGRRRAMPAEQLRQSRTCYHHLAGQLGVLLSNALIRRRLVAIDGRDGRVTEQGLAWCRAEQIDFDPARQPHLRLCNDWTERVPHLAGPFANAVLTRLVEMRGVAPHRIRRALRITDRGRAFFDRLGVQVPF
ncbi:metalloregulator ArsR/SmtB family transcription factor [Bradyrhizobium septentrionale]|nr:metalloregulator ArsR/SmtB family transcription factor [Bradyrhizobium septentrionale]UGY17081.1 metalloregulator ArsR/SmtB family transcription factor [Bradyrhizobium septentrionale]UGY25825.1 metalloregulator ArsR/SmtB family transcription factor [Bradyrhizobium septentrionale]